MRTREMTLHTLLPARFLTLVAHLVITITIFYSREENVMSCLPRDHTDDERRKKDTEIVIALSLTLACFVVELIGFLSGVSMFSPNVTLFSIGVHTSAVVALAYFVVQAWSCDLYWYIFGFCSVLPMILELLVLWTVLRLTR